MRKSSPPHGSFTDPGSSPEIGASRENPEGGSASTSAGTSRVVGPYEAESFSARGMPPEITPTSSFYTVSKNFFDPTVDSSTWSLTSNIGMSTPPSRRANTDPERTRKDPLARA